MFVSATISSHGRPFSSRFPLLIAAAVVALGFPDRYYADLVDGYRERRDAILPAIRAAGFRIVTTNYRCPHGELDIVAEQADLLCFVEVRSRASAELGAPEETIDRRKRARVIHAAEHYLATQSPTP